MKAVEVSPDVFAAIWHARQTGERDENEILARILGVVQSTPAPAPKAKAPKAAAPSPEPHAEPEPVNGNPGVHVRWQDDIEAALVVLGGQASLADLYPAVEAIRKGAGRSVPRTLKQVVRRTLETHCAESSNFTGRAQFKLVGGKGSGVWGLTPAKRAAMTRKAKAQAKAPEVVDA